jgi:hypothetical protein
MLNALSFANFNESFGNCISKKNVLFKNKLDDSIIKNDIIAIFKTNTVFYIRDLGR